MRFVYLCHCSDCSVLFSASRAGAGDTSILAALEQIVRTQQEQARSQHELLTLQQELLRKQALAELDRLLIKPIFSPRSSGSSRSPHPDARFALKVQTIDYYGLWDSSDEPDPMKRRVFTMLPNSP